jgi:SAM-dependent methyltransferase
LGFSPDWLALREPHDHRARDKSILAEAARAAGESPVILDLGCGTGSTIRAMAHLLPSSTSWRLVDNDPLLLSLAALEAGMSSETFLLDLNEVEELPLEGVTLVTASALLDLVSRDWVTKLAAALNVPAYFALSYDGVMSWEPADPEDSAMRSAFNAHQRTDKGFGPALGPDAAGTAREVFEAQGFDVSLGTSPWLLTAEDWELHLELVEGIASAAAEMGETGAEAWGQRRATDGGYTRCIIGHQDLLAIPGSLQLGFSNAVN